MDYQIIFNRCHETYRKNREIWEHSRDAYSGGADYIARALVKHVSEIDLEYLERLRRACYFNYPRKIARLITQYLLSVEPQRENADIAAVEDFSRSGLRANEVMRQFSTLLTVYGSAFMFMDMPFFQGEVDAERKKKENLRPGARVLSPLEVPDWAFGEDGKLNWIIIEEEISPDNGPFVPAGKYLRRVLWTRDEFFVFRRLPSAGNIELESCGLNPLGEVPAIRVADPDGFGSDCRHYFEDVVRISEAILNNGSEAQMNIVKQMFGLLVISDTFARGAKMLENSAPGNGSGNGAKPKFSHLLARSAALWETPEERGISRYISPSGADITAIREENLMLKRELFDVVGMPLRNESTQAQTAESKAWDHHQIRQFLVSRVDILEQTEMKMWELFNRCDNTIPIPHVVYNRDFSVTDLSSAVASLLQLSQLSDSGEFRRELARTGVFLLEKLKKISPEIKKEIIREIENA